MRNREDLGRILKEAFYIARTGRPGPVLIDLPKDVMGELGAQNIRKLLISVVISRIQAYISDKVKTCDQNAWTCKNHYF